MTVTLAFDVYGTLIDTHGLTQQLTALMGDKANAFSHTWRDKQLEYSFRRGLMQCYVDFSVCTRQGLDYACQLHQVTLSTAQKNTLLEAYRELPAFSDAHDGLSTLRAQGHHLFAFSNGSHAAVSHLLENAQLQDFFIKVISVEDLKTFKPSPAVYQHFLSQAESKAETSWLISSNPFDVTGAINAGLNAAWIQRSPLAFFDPWEIQPTATVTNLTELPAVLSG